MIFRIFIFLIVVYFQLCFTECKKKEEKKNHLTIPSYLKEQNCEKGYGYFNQYENVIFLGESNYSLIIEKEQSLVILATHEACLSCCKHEKTIENYGKYLKDKLGLKLGRIEMQGAKGFLDQYKGIKRFPQLLFLKKGEGHFYYTSLFDLDLLRRFSEKIYREKNYRNIKSLQEVEQILELRENSQIVFGFFFDRKELDQEIEQFKQASHELRFRSDIEFYLWEGTKKELKKVKQKFQGQFFEDFSLSSVVISKIKGNFQIIDISEMVQKMVDLTKEIKKMALKLVDEFTMESYQFYQEHKKPILVGVIDSIKEIQKSVQFLKLLEEIAANFVDQVFITWVEGSLNPEKRKMLGIKENAQLPAVAFFRIEMEFKIVFPSEINLNKINLMHFIQDYLEKPIQEVLEKYSTLKQKVKQNVLAKYFKYFKKENLSTQTPFSIDFVYSLDKIIEKEAQVFTHVFKRFQEINLLTKVSFEVTENSNSEKTTIFIRDNNQKIYYEYEQSILPKNLFQSILQITQNYHIYQIEEFQWVMPYDLQKYFNQAAINQSIDQMEFIYQEEIPPFSY